jgi:hypothetical protein
MPVPDPSTDAEIERIAQEIESYLIRHRDAADTALGIARWWLGQPNANTALPRVESALERLVRRGIVVSRVLADGNRVYSAAVDRPAH